MQVSVTTLSSQVSPEKQKEMVNSKYIFDGSHLKNETVSDDEEAEKKGKVKKKIRGVSVQTKTTLVKSSNQF